MLAPKAFLDALGGHASRLFSSETSQPRAELESQFKMLLQHRANMPGNVLSSRSEWRRCFFGLMSG